MKKFPDSFPPQHQEPPGLESKMDPQPVSEDQDFKGCGRLKGKNAIITGGDSGIGRAVAIAFAKEGADVAVIYLNEEGDAKATQRRVEEIGRRCILISGNIGDEDFCQQAVNQTAEALGGIDIVVNIAGEQHPQDDLRKISKEQLRKTFETNIFGTIYITKAALDYLKEGSSIVNTTSITAYRGNEMLIDYSSTKGAVTAFTRSLARNLAKMKIRVNAVAPGPIWTPLIVSTFPEDNIPNFGQNNLFKRAGQPVEIAPSYVFLASDDSSYMTGQVLHPNGGTIIGS